MGEISTIGLDLAKSVFQAHGADASGGVVFRKRLRRDHLLAFFAGQPRCLVAMEACASAHYWAREIAALGHETRLIPPAYVKPFVKRQKNDMADAEAICEAAQRPTMRFVAPKSAEAQAALRGHLAEFGFIVRQGPGHVSKLVETVADPSSELPAEARPVLAVIADSLRAIQARILVLDREIAARAKADPVARRLMTIPGLDLSSLRPWWRWPLRPPPSGEGETSPPGWGSRPGSTPAVARSGWAGQPRWANAACDGC